MSATFAHPQAATQTLGDLEKLAERGDAGAQSKLGNAYLHGEGVAEDDEKGLRWYRRAGELGDVKAQQTLGIYYKLGIFLPRDPAQAAKWLRRAALQEDSFSQKLLADMYSVGEGVPQDYQEAVSWYVKASDHGDKAAAARLATIYRLGGKGIEKDLHSEHCWRTAKVSGRISARLLTGTVKRLNKVTLWRKTIWA
jgi:TPR repeat protein